MLPTPMANDGSKGNSPAELNRHGGGSLVAIPDLLPTPLGSDGAKGGPNQAGGSGDPRISSVESLFPTPNAYEAERGGSQHPDKRRAGGHQPSVADVAEHVLLPTPSKALADGGQTSRSGDRKDELLLGGIAEKLLPTPTAADSEASGGSKPEHSTLTDAVVRTNLGTTENERLLPTPTARDYKDTGDFAIHEDKIKLAHSIAQVANNTEEALLPTPTAHKPMMRSAEAHAEGNHQVTIHDVPHLLPTPTTQESHSGPSQQNRNTVPLNGEVLNLLPTPLTTEHKGSAPADMRRDTPQLRAIDQFLPTPTASMVRNENESVEDWEARREAIRLAAGTGNGFGIPLTKAVQMMETDETLLPTPRASRGASGTETIYALGGERVDDGRPQGEVVLGALLPTPAAHEGTNGGTQTSEEKAQTGQVWLSNVAQDVAQELAGDPDAPILDLTADGELVNWGKYRAAIKRAEAVLGRLSPSPTKNDGKNGNRRLSSALVEFMMLLPGGHVVGRGLKRNDELARLGNGVVPLQAAVATTVLLRRLADSRRAA